MRDAIHQATQFEDCDFIGLEPYSFRRANITRRQQRLMRRIQDKPAKAAKRSRTRSQAVEKEPAA